LVATTTPSVSTSLSAWTKLHLHGLVTREVLD
jgi:hypothetical protein